MATLPLMLVAALYLVYRYLWEEKNIRKSRAAMWVGLGIAAICGLNALINADDGVATYLMGSFVFLPITYFFALVGFDGLYRRGKRENASKVAEEKAMKLIITAITSSLAIPTLIALINGEEVSMYYAAAIIGVFGIFAVLIMFADLLGLEI